MLVSWKWLAEYVAAPEGASAVQDRLMMAGLNREGAATVGDDVCLDLEVTSNRPDCLGHLGVAREIAVLYDRELKIPAADPTESGPAIASLTSVAVEAPDLCPRYTARVLRGVKIGRSPGWLVERLATIGVASVNNVVDATNYVLMECGQPLHAFDLAKLADRRIVVRRAAAGEKITAINHREYELTPEMCVIADGRRPVAVAGVMGGADTEVEAGATDLLIESAEFDPVAVRSAARRLNLHSPSSYRFERGLDPAGVDWASRRCCELILEMAGGDLATGVIDVAAPRPEPAPIVLRLAQIPRVLGIDVPVEEVRRILAKLGLQEVAAAPDRLTTLAPSWRRDLTREIDLIEEVARIHGYEEIPEDVGVPMVPSVPRPLDRLLRVVRHVATAAGYDEAMTLSAVEPEVSEAFSPWTEHAALVAGTPVIRTADQLRRSLLPSLLTARKTNESLSNPVIELFEIAKVYLPQGDDLPREDLLLGLCSGGDYFAVKGTLETLLAELHATEAPIWEPLDDPFFAAGRAARLRFGGETWGFLGAPSEATRKQFGLRSECVVAEVQLAPLTPLVERVPQFERPSAYPSVARDLNLVVDESVRWADLSAAATAAAGEALESLAFADVYRDAQRIGAGKKSFLFTLSLRSSTGTLTSEEADAARDAVVAACSRMHGAALRA